MAEERGGGGSGLVDGEGLVGLVPAPQQLRVSRRRQAEGCAVVAAPPLAQGEALQLVLYDAVGLGRARVARLAAPERRRRPLHVRVVHREVLLDHSVHGHR